MLFHLAERYNRVGDFTCGYGRVGRIFSGAGKTWVMSDYNPTCIGYIGMNASGWRVPQSAEQSGLGV